MANGAIPAISEGVQSQIKIPLPPTETQQQISACLDQKTAQIDALIVEKGKLYDKLTEYRKSLIYEYATGKRAAPGGQPV